MRQRAFVGESPKVYLVTNDVLLTCDVCGLWRSLVYLLYLIRNGLYPRDGKMLSLPPLELQMQQLQPF